MDGYVGFHAALRHSYNCFINNLSKECKQLVRHHLDSVTSPYSQVCYESVNAYRFELSAQKSLKNAADDEMTPGKLVETREAYMTIPETPSPDQPSGGEYVIKTEHGKYIEGGPKKRQSRIKANSKLLDNLRVKHHKGSSYTEICSLASQHFARIREVLIQRSVTSALNSGFLTPW